MVSLAFLGVAAVSRKLVGTPITPAMLFVGFGLLVGPRALDGIDLSSTDSVVRVLAEATLALVLFSDASRVDLSHLRRTVGVPLRLLSIGLPLTILLGAVAAAVLFGPLTAGEAVILGIVLAPTDAALGQAVVTEPRIPERIRQGLNVESGLNDGICVPLLFAAVALADVESNITDGRSAGSAAARGDRLRAGRRSRRRRLDRRDHPRRGRTGLDRQPLVSRHPRRRRRPGLRDRHRAGRVGLHRRVRGGCRIPARAGPRPGAAESADRRGGRRPERRHVHPLRRAPARPHARAAELAARRSTRCSA